MCVFISQQPAGEWPPWTPWSPLELLAGRGCSLGASWGTAEPATARAPCRGEIPAPVTFPGREDKGEMLFAGRVPEALKLPVTVFPGKGSTAGCSRASQALPGMGNSGNVEVLGGEMQNCHGLAVP